MSSTPLTVLGQSTCTDFHGRPVINGTFDSTQRLSCLRLHGDAEAYFAAGKYWTGFRYDQYPISMVTGGCDTANLDGPSGWYADTIARSNPSRPVFTPATLIQDLVELPAMVRDVGRLLMRPKRLLSAKELANQHLAIRFGWVPLVKDIKELLKLQEHVLKRHVMLKRLYARGGLRRRITFADDHQTGQTSTRVTIQTGSYFDFDIDVKVDRKVWATIRWQPTTLPPEGPSDAALHRLASNIVLGLTPEGLMQGAWEVIPWTWMIDWFTNVGSFMLLNSNTVPAQHSSACLMSEVLQTNMGGDISPVNCRTAIGWVGASVYTRKVRTLSGNVVLGFNMPYIDMSRLSVLGSLFVQRFKR